MADQNDDRDGVQLAGRNEAGAVMQVVAEKAGENQGKGPEVGEAAEDTAGEAANETAREQACETTDEDVVQLAGRVFRTYMSAFESHVGVPMPRWRIMEALQEFSNALPPPQKKLVEKLEMDPGALTRQVQSLEERGWICREVDKQDQRLTNVAMTDAGSEELKKATPARDAFKAKVMDGFAPAQLRAVMETLTMLEARIGAVMADASKTSKSA